MALNLLSTASSNACYGAYAAYRVSTAYGGPTCTVRRASDGATSNVYANVSGKFGLGGNATGVPLETWLGGARGYVTQWYDQSGRGNHAVQAVSSNQPFLDPVAQVLDFTGTPYFALPAGTVPLSGPYTVTVKHLNLLSSNSGWLGGGSAPTATNGANSFRRANDSYVNYWTNNDLFGPPALYAPANAVTFRFDGATHALYVNGLQQSSLAHVGLAGTPGNETLGVTPAAEYLNGQLYGCFVFNAALPDAERLVLEAGPALGPVAAGPLALPMSQLRARLAQGASTGLDLGAHAYALNNALVGSVATVSDSPYPGGGQGALAFPGLATGSYLALADASNLDAKWLGLVKYPRITCTAATTTGVVPGTSTTITVTVNQSSVYLNFNDAVHSYNYAYTLFDNGYFNSTNGYSQNDNLNFWCTNNTGNNYNASTGMYITTTPYVGTYPGGGNGASYTTGIVSGYNGEWVTVNLGEAMCLRQFKFIGRSDGYAGRRPLLFQVYGANDGVSWTLVYDQATTGGGALTGASYDGASSWTSAVFAHTGVYQWYALCVSKCEAANGLLNFCEWQLFGNVPTTIEAWLKYPLGFANASGTVGGTRIYPMTLGHFPPAITNGNYDWGFGASTTGALALYYYSAGTTYSVTTAGTLACNAWTHVALQSDGAYVTMYINGALQTLATQNYSGSSGTYASVVPTLTFASGQMTANGPAITAGNPFAVGQYANIVGPTVTVANLRWVAGANVYPPGASFVPPALPLLRATAGRTLLLLTVPPPATTALGAATTMSALRVYAPAARTPGAPVWMSSMLGAQPFPTGHLGGAVGAVGAVGTGGTGAFAAAHSVRLVVSSYAGPVLQLRRDADGALQPFYADAAQTALTTGAGGTGATFWSWVGGGTATVATWYDQSGRGAHLVAVSTSNSPVAQVVNGKVVVGFRRASSNALAYATVASNAVAPLGALVRFYASGADWATLASVGGGVDLSLRLGGPTTGYGAVHLASFAAVDATDWTGAGTQASFNNGAPASNVLFPGDNAFALTVQQPYASNAFAWFGSNPAWPTRALDGYVADALFTAAPLAADDAVAFAANALPLLSAVAAPLATAGVKGGATTTFLGAGTVVHTFTASGALVVATNVVATVLVVAGGGGGSYDRAGGGGAGGMVVASNVLLTPGTYGVVVGAGGAGATGYATGANGGPSSLNAPACLLHMDALVDSGPYALALTAYNGAVVSSSTYKLGTGSLYLPPSGGTGTGYVLTAASAACALGSAPFTLEFWYNWSGVYSASGSGYQRMMSNKTTGWAANTWIVGWDNVLNNGTAHLGFSYYNNGGATYFATTTVPTSNVWTHFAVVRSGNAFSVYTNGVRESVATVTANFAVDDGVTARPLTVGGNPGDSQYWYGYMDEVRLTPGAALYAANFVPPAAPFSGAASSVVAVGGGGGATYACAPGSGGSGGGGYGQDSGALLNGGTGVAGQGFAGGYGKGYSGMTGYSSAGGGGAGMAGKFASCGVGGDGGDGLMCDITGVPTYYAGGGGGARNWSDGVGNYSGLGGLGGGGASGQSAGAAGSAGAPNTGGGGGGGANISQGNGGAGGSGIVVVRYVDPRLPLALTTWVGTVTGATTVYAGVGANAVTVHTWTGVGTTSNAFVVAAPAVVSVLVVGGGGGGGLSCGSGGGAGGALVTTVALAPGTYAVTVGAGGAGSTNGANQGVNGGNSAFAALVAVGGGGGTSQSYLYPSGTGGRSGGSGGGGGRNNTNAGSAFPGQGFAGGVGTSTAWFGGGGGGGGGGAGGTGTTVQGGAGGAGLPCAVTGSLLYYAGGGGGCVEGDGSTKPWFGGLGGRGGGGAGGGISTSSGATGTPGCNAVPSTGGGGGGGTGGQGGNWGGNGGSGVVVVAYPTYPPAYAFYPWWDAPVTVTFGGTTGASGLTALPWGTSPWVGLTAVNGVGGFQTFTVPQTGGYSLVAGGAAGGSSSYGYAGGTGIVVSTTVTLTAGATLYVLVGQQGGATQSGGGNGGGGGATTIARYNAGSTSNTSSYTLLLVAGGGGGAGTVAAGVAAVATTSGTSDSMGMYTASTGGGGINGNGGGTTGTRTWWGGSGGAGWYSAGSQNNPSAGGYAGRTFVQGGTGGVPDDPNHGGAGGFGGGAGGGSNSNWGGGGGGGYSGGAGAYEGAAGGAASNADGGGGGGSFDVNGASSNATQYLQWPNYGAGTVTGVGFAAIQTAGVAAPADVVFWIDAQHSASFVANASNQVTAIYDLSGKGNHLSASQNNAVYTPALINGFPGFDFTTSARLITSPFAATSSVTVAMVVVVRATIAGWGLFWGHFGANHDTDITLRNTSGSAVINWHTNNDNSVCQLAYVANAPVIYVGTMTAGTARYFQMTTTAGGTTSVSTTNPLSWTAGNKSVYVGCSDGSAEACNSYIGECVYWQRVLSTSEINAVVASLRAKWGI